MKIVLCGSPKITLEAFKEVIDNFEVVAIVTQPDRPSGRGLRTTETPVSILGNKNNIRVLKPEKIGQIKDELKNLDFDLLLTFAFGQYIPSSILALSKLPPLNIHGSLLPKYRGASPIHYAILNNDREIGITLVQMTAEIDAGPMFFQASHPLNSSTTTGEAFLIVSNLARDNIVVWLKKIASGTVQGVPQPADFSLSPKISKEMQKITAELTCYQIERLARALNPSPGAFIIDELGKRVKIFNVSPIQKSGFITIKAKDGEVYANDFQYEGKKRTTL